MGWWMFDSQGRYVPCVGVSIGIERRFSIMENSVDTNQRQGEVAEDDTDTRQERAAFINIILQIRETIKAVNIY